MGRQLVRHVMRGGGPCGEAEGLRTALGQRDLCFSAMFWVVLPKAMVSQPLPHVPHDARMNIAADVESELEKFTTVWEAHRRRDVRTKARDATVAERSLRPKPSRTRSLGISRRAWRSCSKRPGAPRDDCGGEHRRGEHCKCECIDGGTVGRSHGLGRSRSGRCRRPSGTSHAVSRPGVARRHAEAMGRAMEFFKAGLSNCECAMGEPRLGIASCFLARHRFLPRAGGMRRILGSSGTTCRRTPATTSHARVGAGFIVSGLVCIIKREQTLERTPHWDEISSIEGSALALTRRSTKKGGAL